MNTTKKISYYFRRYPAVRVLIVLTIIGLIAGSSVLISYRTKSIPEITSINPPVGVPGDVIVITGKNFGATRDMSYVEFSGSKLTASAYISWSDTKIKLVLPANIQDGLVVVGTKDSRSKPSLFANEIDIPVPVPEVKLSSKPVITSLNNQNYVAGDLLVIHGNNFGDSRNTSKVLFTVDYDDKLAQAEFTNINMYTENMIEASDFENAYEYWSNSEIRVRIPDGVCSGMVVVDTGSEKSEPYKINITGPVRKHYKARKIYLMNYTADIADIYTNDVSTITLRCPIPATTAYQPDIQITETNPSPILMNYQNNLIHQLTKTKNYVPKTVFSQTFVLPVYEVTTVLPADRLTSYRQGTLPFVDNALKADTLVPSDDENVVKLAASIIGKEKSSYNKAKLIYNYMCDNFKVQEKVRKGDSDPLDLIKSKKGDAYDYAIVYTALLRAAGVPALTDAGVLVLQEQATQAHWWCEFYIPSVGWIPVDPAIGSGLKYNRWNEGGESVDVKSYYFGNMDSHHITFSRGWNELKPFSQENKIVQQPRSFALQGIWEEASSNTIKYSSYWSLPVIKGIY
ncbi:MAG: IPT/TIG domain-containing protein [Spirochaetia bacterium]|nr:IPT/TIG domain-containing protein [Spirochaetia bacterium]MDD7268622.1 transglutaminase domain-containing protein [Treponema sp.]MDY4985347.1 transglutaminase domain-containing protein [Treponema sp.]